jgi:hypothetical protein
MQILFTILLKVIKMKELLSYLFDDYNVKLFFFIFCIFLYLIFHYFIDIFLIYIFLFSFIIILNNYFD